MLFYSVLGRAYIKAHSVKNRDRSDWTKLNYLRLQGTSIGAKKKIQTGGRFLLAEIDALLRDANVSTFSKFIIQFSKQNRNYFQTGYYENGSWIPPCQTLNSKGPYQIGDLQHVLYKYKITLNIISQKDGNNLSHWTEHKQGHQFIWAYGKI